MEQNDNNFLSIHAIASQLRVPELKYLAGADSEQDVLIKRFFTATRLNPSALLEQTVVQKIQSHFNGKSLAPKFNNLAFMSDRVFDVWLRKNKLAYDINQILGKWRFLFFELLYFQEENHTYFVFCKLLEEIASGTFAWCPFPTRSRKILISELDELEVSMFSAMDIDEQNLNAVFNKWCAYKTSDNAKYEKVSGRLIESERRLATSNYSQALASDYLCQKFSNHFVSPALQTFLDDYWFNFISSSFQEKSFVDLGEALDKLTDDLMSVFCRKGDAAFQLGDKLIDNLLQYFGAEHGTTVPEELLGGLENDIVNILQNKNITEKLYCSPAIAKDLEYFESNTKINIKANQVLLKLVDGDEHRAQVAILFDDSRQMLLTDHVGIKVDLISIGEFERISQSGDYKAISPEASFSRVIETSVTGLSKVASTQKKAREVASEKANKEAELLLKEKEEFAKVAELKAKEIAERARDVELKHAKKRRVLKEKEAYESVSQLEVGGWIGILKEADSAVDDEDGIKRYKLVVKLAAVRKYTFVDKFGISKLQYTEDSLVEAIVDAQVRVLSQGAEFDDNLERVLGRMRMAK